MLVRAHNGNFPLAICNRDQEITDGNPFAGVFRQAFTPDDRVALVLQGDTAEERAADTDGSWKVFHDEAYHPIPPDRARLRTCVVICPGDRV